METKEAVEFIEIEKRIICGCATQCLEAKGFNKVITLLKQGEKYKQMWKEFYKEWGEYPIELHSIDEFMDDIKQKYFPKEAKQDYPESEE